MCFWSNLDVGESENFQLPFKENWLGKKMQFEFCCIFLEIYSTKNIFLLFLMIRFIIALLLFLNREENISDVDVMTLIKQSKTMIFISQPHAISHINECYFHYTIAHDGENQRADSLFQHQMQRSGDWGCLRKKGRDCLQCFLWSTRNCRVLNFTVEWEPEMCR